MAENDVLRQPNAAPEPKKGLGVVGWVLIGCGGLVLLSVLLFVAIGFFVYRSVAPFTQNPALAATELVITSDGTNEVVSRDYDAGTVVIRNKKTGEQTTLVWDKALYERNPELAATKFVLSAQPENEIVSVDEAKNTVTVRNKKTGQTTTINAGENADGTYSMETTGADGKTHKVTMNADGQTGTFQYEDGQTATKMNVVDGEKAQWPAWLPGYPGAAIDAQVTMDSPESLVTTFVFETKDGPTKVGAWYEEKLKGAGMKVSRLTEATDQENLLLAGIDEKRQTNVTATKEAEGTKVTVQINNLKK